MEQKKGIGSINQEFKRYEQVQKDQSYNLSEHEGEEDVEQQYIDVVEEWVWKINRHEMSRQQEFNEKLMDQIDTREAGQWTNDLSLVSASNNRTFKR